MDDNNNGQRIQRDTTDIANAARDISEQEQGIATDVAKETEIDERMAALQSERAGIESDRVARHDREVGDERVIADRDRDLKEALGEAAGHQPPPGPDPRPVPGTGPIAGPGNPPRVPPRRVG